MLQMKDHVRFDRLLGDSMSQRVPALLVEDDANIRSALTNAINGVGLDVEALGDGRWHSRESHSSRSRSRSWT
jgi:hypothetical protein